MKQTIKSIRQGLADKVYKEDITTSRWLTELSDHIFNDVNPILECVCIEGMVDLYDVTWETSARVLNHLDFELFPHP